MNTTGLGRVSNRIGRGILAAAVVAAMGSAMVLTAGCDTGPHEMLGEMFGEMMPPTPSEAARDAVNMQDPDRRRRGVTLLSNASWGGDPVYLDLYRQIVDHWDSDATVRAAAVAALGRHGTVEDVPRIIRMLRNDPSTIVRWEAAKALQRIHDPRAVDALLLTLASESDKDVRMAAANALGQYPQRRVFDALVGALNDEEFGVTREAEGALQTLTGKDLGDTSEAWWEWAKASDDLFANQRTYYFPQYDEPPGLLDKAQFWKEKQKLQPQTPRQPATEVARRDAPTPPELSDDRPTEADRPEPQPQPQPRVEPPSRQPAAQPQAEPESTQPEADAPPSTRPQPEPESESEPDQTSGDDEDAVDMGDAGESDDAADDDQGPDQPERRRPIPRHPLGASG